MSYEINTKSNYSVGANSGLSTKIKLGLTGLCLMVESLLPGCVSGYTVNGVKFANESKPKIVAPDYTSSTLGKKDNKDDKTAYWVVGGILAAGAVGTGAYFLNEELNRNKTDDYVPVFGGG